MTAPVSLGGCQAKEPMEVPTLGRTFSICYQPARKAYIYQCECAHIRVGVVCEGHDPLPGAIGCAQCWQNGHDCPMTFEEIPPRGGGGQ